MMTGVSWRIRPFTAAADRAWVRLLWQASMPPSWPVLPAGIGQLGEGPVAQASLSWRGSWPSTGPGASR